MTRDAWAKLRDYPARSPRRIVGLMTGTSADAIDAALVRFDRPGDAARPVLERYRETPLDESLRGWILELAGAEAWRPEALMELDAELGERYAVAVEELLREHGLKSADVDAIASHGQTVRHLPRGEDAGRARTLQIGSAAILAERTGIAVVSDFRSRDTAAGGEGAPLVPMADAWLFGSDEESRVLLNLGGMANLTVLPKGRRGEAFAFDTGPGNAVSDALAALRSHGRERLDRGGAFAAGGRADEALIAELLADPFFAAPPPRSTGRERFGAAYASALREKALGRGLGEADVAATALELTAASVADAVRRFVTPRAGAVTVFASGGGVANPALMAALARRLAPAPVRSLESLGVPPGAKEAMAFAMLGHLTLSGLPGNVPAATGAAHSVVLGHVTPGA